MGDGRIRVLPRITSLNEAFWTGGAAGELRVLRCCACGYWIHPPAPVCPSCHGRDLSPEATSGRGRVHSYTVNHQVWNPTWPHPYTIVIVELAEQAGLRLTSNLVGVAPDAVTIGATVEVFFEQHEDVWLPLFRPVREAAGAGSGP